MKLKRLVPLAMILLLLVFPSISLARVSIHISLPPLVFPAPPPTVVIPGTYAYFCPDVGVDIFFYHGYWYRPYEEHWFRSGSYNGPWVYITNVPSVLLGLPPDYRYAAPEHRIPYGELHRNWRSWERGRYWEKRNWERHEGFDRGRERHGSYGERER